MISPAVRRCMRVGALLVVAGVLLAAEPPAQRPAPDVLAAVMPQLRQWQAQLMAMPRLAGLAMILAAGLPLFFGWTLMRLCSAATMAAIAGLATWQVLEPQVTSTVLWGSVGFAVLLAGVLGWFLYQILIALKGAALIGMLFFALAQQLTPPTLQAPWFQVVLGASAVAGSAIGAVMGWRLAPWVAIIETVLLGTVMAAAGVVTLAKPGGDTQILLVMAFTALTALPAGLFVQARREAGRSG